MMKLFLAVVGALVLAIASPVGFAAAQTDTPVNADGAYVVANDDGAPIASGAGDDLIYGDINTGGGGGEVLGDPSAVYSPALPDHPGRGEMIVMPGAGDGLIGGVPVMPIIQPTGPGTTAAPTTDLATAEGTTPESVPVEATTTSEGAPVETTDTAAAAPESTEAVPEATESETTSTGFCASYGTWYDAQVTYEELGATAADPALVDEVDSDYDGIACEEIMPVG
jgi:hypothetical protein